MYDIGVALRRFRGLIRWTAWRYAKRGHFRMSVEDLEAEGLLTLVECCRAFPEGQFHFARYFKRAWYNRIKKLIRYENQGKRTGQEVNIDIAEEIPTEEPAYDYHFHEQVVEWTRQIGPQLSPEARLLLKMLVEPSEEVMEFAWRDWCRKQKLRSQGVRVPGSRKFRIRIRHIRGVLKMPRGRLRELLHEIRYTYLSWRKTNGVKR